MSGQEEFDVKCFADKTLEELQQRYGASLAYLAKKRDDCGTSALFYALMNVSPDSAEFLLANGADVVGSVDELRNIVRHFPRTKDALDPKVQPWIAIFEKLIAAGANPHDDLMLWYSIGTPLFMRCIKLHSPTKHHRTQRHTMLDQALACTDLDAITELRRLGIPCSSRKMSLIRCNPRNMVERINCGQVFGAELWRLTGGEKEAHDAFVLLYLSGDATVTQRVKEFCSGVVVERHHFYPDVYGIVCDDHLFFYGEAEFVEQTKLFEAAIEFATALYSSNPLATPARPLINRWSLYLLARFALDACTGLATLDLPALLTATILRALLDERWLNIDYYHYYQFACAVKHFRNPPRQAKKKNRLV